MTTTLHELRDLDRETHDAVLALAGHDVAVAESIVSRIGTIGMKQERERVAAHLSFGRRYGLIEVAVAMIVQGKSFGAETLSTYVEALAEVRALRARGPVLAVDVQTSTGDDSLKEGIA